MIVLILMIMIVDNTKSDNDNISNTFHSKNCKTDVLSNLRIKNVNKLIVGNLNIY